MSAGTIGIFFGLTPERRFLLVLLRILVLLLLPVDVVDSRAIFELRLLQRPAAQAAAAVAILVALLLLHVALLLLLQTQLPIDHPPSAFYLSGEHVDVLILLMKPLLLFCLLHLDGVHLTLFIEKLGLVFGLQPLHLLAEALAVLLELLQSLLGVLDVECLLVEHSLHHAYLSLEVLLVL